MKITLIQFDIAWGKPAENRRRCEEFIMQNPDSVMYVMPEMFSTGFTDSPFDMAEEDDNSETVNWMKQVANQRSCILLGSICVHDTDGTYRNRLYCVAPDGQCVHYDKRHLFSYGNEDLYYSHGDSRVVMEWQGIRMLVQICYDLRFPTFSRNFIHEDGSADYDAIIYVASWPASRRRVWDVLLQARAIENQCYVLAVNRVGSDPRCTYDGGTCVVDPYGRVVAQCDDNQECTITYDLELDALHRFRDKFPVLKDAD